MKKIVITLILIFIAITATLAFTACQKPAETPEDDHISYMQQSFYMGKTKDFTVRLTGGVSETLFVADGRTVNVVPFTTLTVIPQHVDLFNEAYDFTLTGDAGTVSGKLDKDSFGASYSASVDLTSVGTPLSVTVRSDKIEQTIDLADMLKGSVTGTAALDVAQRQLADKLAASQKEREIYVKYINDADSAASDYYWYVAFIASPTDYYAVLVSPDGQIVSVNP